LKSFLPHWRAALAAPIAMAILSSMCAGEPHEAASRISPVYNAETGRLEVLKYDANGNGKVDTWSHMDGAKVLWVEIDTDEDGVVDRWEYYTPDQKLLKVGLSRGHTGTPDSWVYRDPAGAVAKIEYSSKAKGVVDRTEIYEHDALVRVEEDTDGDQRVDRWETYVDGALATASYDTAHRGAPDHRLVYRPDGTLDRIETDPDATGTFRRIKAPR
jgi:hypothetical protein